jgi:hypothetical protein
VRWHGDGHPAAGHAQVLELYRLVDERSGVAGGSECLPRKVWKTLPVQLAGIDRTVSAVLENKGTTICTKM